MNDALYSIEELPEIYSINEAENELGARPSDVSGHAHAMVQRAGRHSVQSTVRHLVQRAGRHSAQNTGTDFN